MWERTALFLTFDENDGFYDHVPPPLPPEGTEGEFVDGLPIGLGYRVPMTIVSPWTVGGYVCSEVFDHTSTIRFVERWLGVEEPNITQWRRRVAGDLTSAFDFTAGPEPAPESGREPEPVTGAAVTVPPLRLRWAATPPTAPELAAQEPGTRPARPLPYRPEASAALTDAGLVVTMADTGDRGSHFTLYPYAGEFSFSRHVDVHGTQSLTVPVQADAYRLVLTGPNSFRREFAGSRAGAAASGAAASRGEGQQLIVTIHNPGPTALTFTLQALAYGTGRHEARVGAGERTVVDWPAESGWYDLRLTVAEDPTFHRRMMGHLETGQAGVSG